MASKKKRKVVKKAKALIKKAVKAKAGSKSATLKLKNKKNIKTKSASKVSKKIVKKAQPKKTISKKSKPLKKQTEKVVKKAAPALKPLKIDYSKAITPLGDRLVVKLVAEEKITAGGLIIPDTAQSIATGYLRARVMAVGAGAKNKKGNLKPLDVKVGDNILFSQHSGTKISFNSEELQIIHESDVMGIIQN